MQMHRYLAAERIDSSVNLIEPFLQAGGIDVLYCIYHSFVAMYKSHVGSAT